MRFEFLPRKSYKNQFAVTPSAILNYFETIFISKNFLIVLAAVIKDKKINIESQGTKKKKKNDDDNDNDADGDVDAPDKTMDQIEKGGFGEGHASSDEEELADDADATEARKRARQTDNDFAEELSDEEVEMVKHLDKELGDDPDDIPDLDDYEPKSLRTQT